MALAVLVAAGCSDGGGSSNGPPEPFQLYGGNPPSALEGAITGTNGQPVH